MVSTRKHPSEFSSPTSTPSSSQTLAIPDSTSTPRRSGRASARWAHTPSNLTLLWLAISVPLVLWDTGYVLGRPYTFPGGSLHWPLWVPYSLYGKIDGVYSVEAWEQADGFTGAQALVNLLECSGYGVYLLIVYMYGRETSGKGRGAPEGLRGYMSRLARPRAVEGSMGSLAAVLGFAIAVATFSKTMLYAFHESFSGFKNVRHNDLFTLMFLYILPNVPWIILPMYMIYVFGQEIIEGLEAATGNRSESSAKKRS